MIIRNIWGVGRNYADHIQEMASSGKSGSPSAVGEGSEKATPSRAKHPLIFLKAGSSASVNSTEIVLPWWCQEVHHELELALKLSNRLSVLEAAVALDLTERTLQGEAKKKGEPWTAAKSFDGACAISSFFQVNSSRLQDLRLNLWVNEELRQTGHTSQMLFSCQEILDHLMERYPLCAGDLILTGTPAGVGPLQDGDVVKASIEKEIVHVWKVRKAQAPKSGASESTKNVQESEQD
ncbi:MAG: fumarylacetoacetate hydrolase family protein [Bdellovibrio sp.]